MRATSFADVLSEALGERPRPQPAQRLDLSDLDRWHPGLLANPAANEPVLPAAPWRTLRRRRPPGSPRPAAATSPSPRRRWSAAQRAALAAFADLGAQLAPDPSFEAVRRAFRRLARSLHPDTAGATADGAAFSRLMDAWDVVRTGPVGAWDGPREFRPLF